MRFLSLVLATVLIAPCAVAAGPPAVLTLEGRVALPHDLTFDGIRVGGLSALQYDGKSGRFWSLSDDRADFGPVRAYRLRLDLTDSTGALRKEPRVEVEGVLALLDAKGKPYAPGAIDPEGWAPAPGGGWFFSTEPILDRGVPPLLAEFTAEGRLKREIPLPEAFKPAAGKGIRHNLGFEGLAVTPDGRWLFAGLENGLAQDGPVADTSHGSPARILRFDLEKGGPPAQFVYVVEPVSARPARDGGFIVNGLSDLLALDADRVLILERQFVEGVGNQARIWEASFEKATNVGGLPSLAGKDFAPAEKRLLVDLEGAGIPLENFEGMTFGPALPDGRGTLVVVSDDNFSNHEESTVFLIFSVDFAPVTISRVQGPGHKSPLAGSWVRRLTGVVTAVDRDSRSPGFWMESDTPDDDPRTSEGIYVSGAMPGMKPGMSVAVNGRVEEFAQPRGLSVTRVRALAIQTLDQKPTLPAPVKLFTGLPIPNAISSEGFSRFDRSAYAIDLWESLEGMRVEIPAGTAIGPTLSRGDIAFRPDGMPRVERSSAGGLRLTSPSVPLEKVSLGSRISAPAPRVDVGARLKGPITGIVDYAGSTYRVQVLSPLEVEKESGTVQAETPLRGDSKHLTLATFNVENFSVAGPADKAIRLGEVIAKKLRGPDIISVEEVQDDSGPAKGDGIVTSKRTVETLTAAIAAAGGPLYEGAWIDPVEGKEGGQPGGNIRLVLLWNPARVELVRRGQAGPLDATLPQGSGGELQLSLSPGRVAPASPAFTLGDGEGVRRSLAAEFRFRGRTFFVIANHWSSKSDDDRLFGNVQPPRTPTFDRRVAQAKEIRAFIESLLAADPKARIVALGDLNDMEFTDPVKLLARAPLENLILRVPQERRYTFNFDGMSQVLDHVVVSPALAEGAEIDIAHINADFSFEKRASDHDPVVVKVAIP